MSNILQEKPIEMSIKKKLEILKPYYMDIINESYMHNVSIGSESHFKVLIVSKYFKNMPLLKRHRTVHEILNAEFLSGVHALSIIAKTPEEWEVSEKTVPSSPNCQGGFGK